jgi:hypothetical protein
MDTSTELERQLVEWRLIRINHGIPSPQGVPILLLYNYTLPPTSPFSLLMKNMGKSLCLLHELDTVSISAVHHGYIQYLFESPCHNMSHHLYWSFLMPVNQYKFPRLYRPSNIKRSLATAHGLFDPWESQLVHFHSQLEQVVQTLALSLCLGGVVAPDIAARSNILEFGRFPYAINCYDLHSVSANKYGICVGVFVHGRLQATGEILLKGSVLDDRNLQSIKESEHTLALTTRNTFDLLNVVDLKASIRAFLSLYQ